MLISESGGFEKLYVMQHTASNFEIEIEKYLDDRHNDQTT